jgi:hypothetical protein
VGQALGKGMRGQGRVCGYSPWEAKITSLPQFRRGRPERRFQGTTVLPETVSTSGDRGKMVNKEAPRRAAGRSAGVSITCSTLAGPNPLAVFRMLRTPQTLPECLARHDSWKLPRRSRAAKAIRYCDPTSPLSSTTAKSRSIPAPSSARSARTCSVARALFAGSDQGGVQWVSSPR